MRTRSTALLVATSFAVIVLVGPTLATAAGPSVNGGGSSMAVLAVHQWRAEVARSPHDLAVNYVTRDSRFGRQNYISGALDFAVTDYPFTASERPALEASGRSHLVYVPVIAQGVGFTYRLFDRQGASVNGLRLTRRLVCRIFTEASMQWDDPELVAANPSIQLPAAPLVPIVRSDEAGESYSLQQFCITVAPDVWAAFVARVQNDPNVDPELKAGRPSAQWPPGYFGSAESADGVAATVAGSPGFMITYVDASQARVRGLPNAAVENAAGTFTTPTFEAISAGLAQATAPDGLVVPDIDSDDPTAYSPAVASYLVAQTTGYPIDRGEVIARFACYAVTYGQREPLVRALSYAQLSGGVIDAARASISQIPGAPPWEQCAVGLTPPAEVPEVPLAWLFAISTATVLAVGGRRIARRAYVSSR